MNCEWIAENAVLYVYGELPDEQRHQAEQHIMNCERCRAEVGVYEQMRHVMDLAPAIEPSPNLVAHARMKLEDALDRLPPTGVIGRWRQAMTRWSAILHAAPVMAGILVVAGFAGGGVTSYLVAHHARPRVLRVGAMNNAQIAIAGPDENSQTAEEMPQDVANISGITSDPQSNLVQVRYNQLVPGSIEGSPDDPRIRQLLLLATQNRVNPGVRVDSVGLLAAQCNAGRDCGDAQVRDALISSLREDKNPGVRLKALDGLAPYVAQDVDVRNAVLDALMHDDNPGIRTEAIQLLSPVSADSSVREVLHTLSNSDRNPYIRTVSTETLQNEPEIQ
jgi:hypothetical protein